MRSRKLEEAGVTLSRASQTAGGGAMMQAGLYSTVTGIHGGRMTWRWVWQAIYWSISAIIGGAARPGEARTVRYGHGAAKR